MFQFEVMPLRDGSRTLLMVDTSHYDYVWGFYRPVKRLEN